MSYKVPQVLVYKFHNFSGKYVEMDIVSDM